MRNWEEDCKTAGAILACDPVICNDEPDDDAKEACQNLWKSTCINKFKKKYNKYKKYNQIESK